MAHFRLVGQRKQIFIDLVAAQAGSDNGVTNCAARLVRTPRTVDVALAQPPDEFQRFVCGDAAADDQQNLFALQRGHIELHP